MVAVRASGHQSRTVWTGIGPSNMEVTVARLRRRAAEWRCAGLRDFGAVRVSLCFSEGVVKMP